jgi:AcrR family transcriptional regulator
MASRRTKPARERDGSPKTTAALRKRAPRDPVGTRARILAAAERLFAERGYAGAAMPAIAQASGISAGAIYKHFDSKTDLFFEVIRDAMQSSPVAGPEADATALPVIVASFAERRLKRVRQLAVEAHYAAAKDPNVRQLLREAVERDIGRLAETIAAGQRDGAFDKAVDPKPLGAAVLVFIMGLMHLETLAPELIGDAAWAGFVQERVAAMMGAPTG